MHTIVLLAVVHVAITKVQPSQELAGEPRHTFLFTMVAKAALLGVVDVVLLHRATPRRHMYHPATHFSYK